MEEFLKSLRNDHTDFNKGSLVDQLKEVNPFVLMKGWLQEAYDNQCKEPNSMVISTVGKNGMPSSRVVFMKEILEEGFVFYTNYESKKAGQLQENPKIAALFFWENLSRQIRIQGVVKKADTMLSDNYFHSRPRGSKIGAWASKQSAPIKNRQTLEEEVKKIEKKWEGKEVPRPPFWGGLLIRPLYFEFWQGRPNRVHDRIAFQRENIKKKTWEVTRLNP